MTYSGQFTHVSGHPSGAGQVQDRESSPVEDQRSFTVPRNQPVSQHSTVSPVYPDQIHNTPCNLSEIYRHAYQHWTNTNALCCKRYQQTAINPLQTAFRNNTQQPRKMHTNVSTSQNATLLAYAAVSSLPSEDNSMSATEAGNSSLLISSLLCTSQTLCTQVVLRVLCTMFYPIIQLMLYWCSTTLSSVAWNNFKV